MKRRTVAWLVACAAHGVAVAAPGQPTPAPAAPATPAAAAAPAAKPAAPPPAPKPPAEIADMLKSVQGTWSCDGTVTGADGKAQKIKSTIVRKADLDGFWIHDSISVGPLKTPTFRIESFTTYDPATKRWRRVEVSSEGAQMVGNAETMKDMKMDFMFDTIDASGSASLREHIDASDLHKGLHLTGELSKDKGKSWIPDYDVVCRR